MNKFDKGLLKMFRLMLKKKLVDSVVSAGIWVIYLLVARYGFGLEPVSYLAIFLLWIVWQVWYGLGDHLLSVINLEQKGVIGMMVKDDRFEFKMDSKEAQDKAADKLEELRPKDDQ